MKIPVVRGIIDRRILVNYTVDPEVVKKLLPAPFRPKLYNGKAIVGICLIRLKQIRPKGLPAWLGIGSENGAHRIAVEWTENDELKEGVFVPRRDTSSCFNAAFGGRLFPGRHHQAKYHVTEADDHYQIAFKSDDDTTISIEATLAETYDTNSIFKTLSNASGFFEGGAVGFSPKGSYFEGLELKTFNWHVQPLSIKSVQSSFFEDERNFPIGSIQFDNALLMTNMEHEWHSAGNK